MIDADRESYARQFEAAKRRLPRGHVISHAVWRAGQLFTMSSRIERVAKAEPEFVVRVRRGLNQQDLFAKS